MKQLENKILILFYIASTTVFLEASLPKISAEVSSTKINKSAVVVKPQGLQSFGRNSKKNGVISQMEKTIASTRKAKNNPQQHNFMPLPKPQSLLAQSLNTSSRATAPVNAKEVVDITNTSEKKPESLDLNSPIPSVRKSLDPKMITEIQQKAQQFQQKNRDKFEQPTPEQIKKATIKASKIAPEIITVYHPEKMEAPLESYITQLTSEVSNQYATIPAGLRTAMEIPYAIEFINKTATGRVGGEVLGYNKIPVKAIRLPETWNVAHPDNLQKISAGFDALADSYTKNPRLDTSYNPKTKTIFMTEPAQAALANLKAKFPHTPEKLLQAMEIEFRQEHHNRYQKKYLIFDDTTKPIQVKAADITKNPEWPTEKNSEGDYIGKPSKLQKLYAAAQAIESIALKVIATKEAAQNPSLFSFLPSLPREIWNKGVQATLINTAQNYVNAKTASTQAKQPLEYPKDFETPMLDIKTNEKITKPSFSIASIPSYLAKALKASAKAIKNSPKELPIFVRKTINTFAQMVGLSKKDTDALQAKGRIEVDILIQDKKSWFYATDREFNSKFNSWMKSIVTDFNKSLGKSNPTDIRIIQLDAGNNNPLTPKITLNYNKNSKMLNSATIEYKGNSYAIDLKDLQMNDKGEYIITTQLYKKVETLRFWDSMIHNRTVKNTVQSIKVTPTSELVSPEIINLAEKMLIVDPKVSDGILTIIFDTKTGRIQTNVNTEGSIYSHKENNSSSASQATSPKAGTITLRKIYDINSDKQNIETPLQEIQLTGPPTDIFAPKINIQYDPALVGTQAIKGVSIEHENKLIKTGGTEDNPTYAASNIKIRPEEINFDSRTGTYTITTTRLRENAQQVAGLKDKVLSMIQDPQLKAAAAPALEAVQNYLSKLSAQAYKDVINNLDTGYVPAVLKNILDSSLGPKVYNDVKALLLKPIPTAIEKIAIEFNPTHNVVATRVIQEMSDRTVEKTELTYPIN